VATNSWRSVVQCNNMNPDAMPTIPAPALELSVPDEKLEALWWVVVGCTLGGNHDMKPRRPNRKLAVRTQSTAMVPRVDSAQQETGLQSLERDAETVHLSLAQSRRAERFAELDRRAATEEAIERDRAQLAVERAERIASFRQRLGEASLGEVSQ
jgi:hypothetical protein